MGSQGESVHNEIFESIRDSLEELREERRLRPRYWYHDEPRWLLRWGDNPLRQLEVRLEGETGNYKLKLSAGVFEAEDWHVKLIGDLPVLISLEDGRLSYSVRRGDFRSKLEEAFSLAQNLRR